MYQGLMKFVAALPPVNQSYSLLREKSIAGSQSSNLKSFLHRDTTESFKDLGKGKDSPSPVLPGCHSADNMAVPSAKDEFKHKSKFLPAGGSDAHEESKAADPSKGSQLLEQPKQSFHSFTPGKEARREMPQFSPFMKANLMKLQANSVDDPASEIPAECTPDSTNMEYCLSLSLSEYARKSSEGKTIFKGGKKVARALFINHG